MAKIMMIQMQPAPYTGTAYLNGAASSQGHKLVLHLGHDIEKCLSAISLERPDCIGFSCMSGVHKEALEIAVQIKKNFDIPIIMGGPHPTLFPDVIRESCIDMICRGEGEFALIDLLNALDNKSSYYNIPNLWVKHGGMVYENNVRPLVDPLDGIPLIDWSCYQGTIIQESPPIAFPIRG